MLEKLEQWKKDLEELEKERIKQQAVVDQALRELKELGYDNLEEAEKILEELKTKRAAAAEKAETLMLELEKKYEQFIDSED